MTRQSEKNLLVTVAAFVTTALLVVVFQSSVSQTSNVSEQSALRVAREASEDDGTEGNTSYDPENLTDEESNQLQDDLFSGNIDERSGDASERRGGRKKDKNRFNPARIRADSINALKPQMLAAMSERETGLETFNEIAGAAFAKGDPSYAGQEGDPENNFPGFDKTAPAVQKFIDEFQCSTGNFWSDTADEVNLYFLLPSTIPLFGNDPVKDYANYVEFIAKVAGGTFPNGLENKNFKYIVGQYAKAVKFGSARKFKNVNDVHRVSGKFKKPVLSAAQPNFFKNLRGLKVQLERKASTTSMGRDCVLVWFFHDIPQDLDEFMNPDNIDILNDFHSSCTLVPFFVSPSTSTNRDTFTRLAAQMVPGRQFQYGKDADYDGIFYAESLTDLSTNDDLVTHFNNYMCMLKNRCLCRIANDGFFYPASEIPTSAGTTTIAADDFRAVDYDDPVATTDVTTEGTTTTAFSTTAPLPPKEPEIDSCCGHLQFGGVPYDSELRTCCDDAVPRAYLDDGSDPCF